VPLIIEKYQKKLDRSISLRVTSAHTAQTGAEDFHVQIDGMFADDRMHGLLG
jgi:hypothetical protein